MFIILHPEHLDFSHCRFPPAGLPNQRHPTLPGHGVVNQLPLLKDLTLILGNLLTTGNDLDGLALLHATHVHFIVFPGDGGWQDRESWWKSHHLNSMVYGMAIKKQ